MGRLMFAVDFVIVAISAIAYQSLESALHAAISIFVSTHIIDAILYGADAGTGKMLYVISEKSDEIAARILNELDRGVTKLKAQGAYSGRPLDVLLCAVRRDEAHSVMDLIHEEDENAFLIVGDANSITGRRLPSRKAGGQNHPGTGCLSEGKAAGPQNRKAVSGNCKKPGEKPAWLFPRFLHTRAAVQLQLVPPFLAFVAAPQLPDLLELFLLFMS